VVEAEFKEFILRDLWSIAAVVLLTYLFIGFLALAGSTVRLPTQGGGASTSWVPSIPSQAIGSSIVVISMLILSAIGQYTYSSALSGRLEALLAAPIKLPTILIASTVPMIAFGIIAFASTAAPAIYIAISSYGPTAVLEAIAVLSIGMVPLFALGLLLSIAVARLGSPILLNLFQGVVFTFSGALYPIAILPEILRLLPLSLPVYYIVEALRGVLLEGGGVLRGVPPLLILSIAYGSIGSILYRRFSRALRGGSYG